jgi:DNA-binding CsgD family transcriptional regulator
VTITAAQAIVLKLADEGKSPEQIALELGQSTRVIKTQLTRIRRKVAGGAFNPQMLCVRSH